eukprot:scaffold36192_cov38-Prasinocladus_malaysianus.AAC.1
MVLMHVTKDFDLTHPPPMRDHGAAPTWDGAIPNLVPTANALLTKYHAKCNGPSIAFHDSFCAQLALKIYTLHSWIIIYMHALAHAYNIQGYTTAQTTL